jgi:phenylpropionate dioxygenase-like ring-hydroxylating dioxygenase large terminal subunit
MLSAADNDLLCRTGPETPMGQYFRRFWQPVALPREVAEPGGTPLRVHLMGQEFLLFRASDGRLGLVEPRCPHRGAHLFWGRNEECGLRCVYHGWKFGPDGAPMDLPNVPENSPYHQKIRLRAWPVREFGDIVWGWLGLADDVPELPQFEFATLPASHRYVTKKLQECNWAQTIEGALDTSHFSFLHMPAPGVESNANPDAPADEKRLRWIREDPMPRFEIIEHEVGFVLGGGRRADGQRYWRTAQFMLPCHATTPSTLPGENYFGYSFVPITDERCWVYTYVWNPDRPLTAEERAKLDAGHGVVAEVGPDFVPVRNIRNDYLIDRAAQRTSSYTGVRGVAEQDAMVQESQGPIADRTRENLTATDVGVVAFRRSVMNGARALAKGEPPRAPRHADAYHRRSGSWFAAEEVPMARVLEERFGDPRGLIPLPA